MNFDSAVNEGSGRVGLSGAELLGNEKETFRVCVGLVEFGRKRKVFTTGNWNYKRTKRFKCSSDGQTAMWHSEEWAAASRRQSPAGREEAAGGRFWSLKLELRSFEQTVDGSPFSPQNNFMFQQKKEKNSQSFVARLHLQLREDLRIRDSTGGRVVDRRKN